MGMFFHMDCAPGSGRRAVGFQRYTEILERDWKRFVCVNFLTFIFCIPFLTGLVIALLSTSSLLLIPVCIIGGLIMGPGLAGLYDCLYRSLRDAPGGWFENYKKALGQNWKSALIPGVILSLVTGFTAFMVMMLSETGKGLSISTLFVLLLGLVLTLMITGIYFPQMVLFSLSPVIRLSNCLVFSLTHPVKVIGTSLLQLIWFLLFALFMPWSMILMPFMGLWFILLVSHFILYDDMNESFAIEERIAQVYPDQVAVYEDDAAWLRRKQEEAMQTR